MKNNKKGGFGSFLAGRGFYAAMAVCLLGAVGAAWITASRTISSLNEKEGVSVPENRVVCAAFLRLSRLCQPGSSPPAG